MAHGERAPPSVSTSTPISRSSITRTGTRLAAPTNSATKRVRGRQYTSSGSAFLDQPAAREHRDARGEREGLGRLGSGVERGDAHLAVQPRELEPHRAAERRVQARQRLVEQEQARPNDEGPGQRHPLRLPAG